METKKHAFWQAAIQKDVKTHAEKQSPAEEYRARVEGYAKAAGLRGVQARKVPRKITAMAWHSGSLFCSGWTGEVFVYTKDLEFKEQFRAANQSVQSMRAYGDTLVLAHARGVVTAIENKRGVSTTIQGFKHGVLHPAHLLCIAQTETGLEVHSIEQGRGVGTAPQIRGKPVAVHPFGACVAISGQEGGLADLRTMKVEVPLEKAHTVGAGIFHSSGVDMVLGRKRNVDTIDIRNMGQIRKIKTKFTPTVFHEFQKAVFYSGGSLHTRGVCTITGTEFARIPEETTGFASTPDVLFSASASTVLHAFNAGK
ncbi:hypothetical protein NECID01_0041 [Nematocida sp. AWRm77]|nr:hypothetical protein NECID01_0041 [Nematocida sp. AWRm77]